MERLPSGKPHFAPPGRILWLNFRRRSLKCWEGAAVKNLGLAQSKAATRSTSRNFLKTFYPEPRSMVEGGMTLALKPLAKYTDVGQPLEDGLREQVIGYD